jgi:hypothetical protein
MYLSTYVQLISGCSQEMGLYSMKWYDDTEKWVINNVKRCGHSLIYGTTMAFNFKA